MIGKLFGPIILASFLAVACADGTAVPEVAPDDPAPPAAVDPADPAAIGSAVTHFTVVGDTGVVYEVSVVVEAADDSPLAPDDYVLRAAAEQYATLVHADTEQPVTPGAEEQDAYSDANRAGLFGILAELGRDSERSDWPRERLDALADRLDALFDAPGDDPVRLKAGEVRGVAAELRERESISPPYIAAILGTLVDPEQDR